MALLQRDEPLDQLRSFFIEKLEEFMEKGETDYSFSCYFTIVFLPLLTSL